MEEVQKGTVDKLLGFAVRTLPGFHGDIIIHLLGRYLSDNTVISTSSPARRPVAEEMMT